ncbi:P-loop containing nucleoside triphosphate hydrolase protein [Cyathus striatus]|nr:P-loop containing nucleoside triphosphate hydrolase protein [Cyathus striatus]
MKLSNPLRPSPAPPGFGERKEIPEVSASILSKMWFSWLDPFLGVGFSRPLEKEDFWQLPRSRLTSSITDKVESNFYSRCPEEKRPPSWRSSQKTCDEDSEKVDCDYPPPQPKTDPKPAVVAVQDASLFSALFQTFKTPIYFSGILKLSAGIDIAEHFADYNSLLNKVLLNWLVASFVYVRTSEDERAALGLTPPRGIGYGIGLAFALFVMQEAASLMDNHATKVSMELGMRIRTAIIGNVFRKSLRLSGKGRAEHSVGKITTHISTDATKLDLYCMTAHSLWTSPIQFAIGIGLLIGNLGIPPWLVLIFGFPVQFILVKILMVQYAKGVKITDQRVRLITEVLQGIRLIKYYAWEMFYSARIAKLRKMELKRVRRMIVALSWMISTISFIPLLATVLSFITYSLTGHDLNVAVIFTALQLFNIIRIPLHFPLADELEEPYKIDFNRESAVEVNGSFVWELPAGEVKMQTPSDEKKDSEKVKESSVRPSLSKDSPVLPVVSSTDPDPKTTSDDDEKPFELNELKLNISKGSFVAIVGRVGSGKSSLLQAILGEMRRSSGEEEVLLTLNEVIHACSLEQDLQILPSGEATEIGEKGINLSGGQKARVSLARAAYSSADIVLLDDPLSAVDSHVGNAIVENCFLTGPLANRTRILVTHALHVLDKTLLSNQGPFSRLIEEYGNQGSNSVDKTGSPTENDPNSKPSDVKTETLDDSLMQLEDRAVGAGLQVANTLFLGFWTAESIHGFKQGDYIAVYSALGAAQAVTSFFLTFMIGIDRKFQAFPRSVAWYIEVSAGVLDTTPIGRILSRLSKDVEAVDTQISMGMLQSFILSPVRNHFRAFSCFVYPFCHYYRRSSVETKRLDSLMRSGLYSSYSEALTGLSTIRAYGLPKTFITTTDNGLDMENRAYYMTITIQRWLGVRLDFFGNILILGIGLFAAGFRHSVNPAKIGVVLSYALTITQVFSEMVSQFAQNEQNMNAVERLLYYAHLPREGNSLDKKDPPADWPRNGKICLSSVKLAYRENLPLALKGVSLQIHPGEKIGIVGRTGAGTKIHIWLTHNLKINPSCLGKSSLVHALLRTVELREGVVEIDDLDIKEIDLDVLRQRLGLVPQDNILFLGTLRDNIDPENLRTDAELIAILQKAQLLPRDGTSNPAAEAKFSLDSVVSDEGSNFSVGEKQLLALCRCLVKNSKIIILDEATSSIDAETDAKIQRTIRTEFSSSTLVCIAHRLHTIAYYDRIIVMDGGTVAEFDTVHNLFDKEDSIFRSLCDQASLRRSDIEKLRSQSY